MTTLNWPGFGISAITPTLDQPATVNSSAYTGVRRVIANPWHGKWSFKVTLATRQGDANFQAVRSFFTSLKGAINNFHLPAVEAPQNANTGVTLSANAAQGATSLALTGVTTALVAGNMVTIAGQLLSLTSVGALSAGAQTVSFMPALRAAALSGASVETAKPYALVALRDSSFSWDIAQWRQYGLSFDADEDVNGADGASPALDVWTGGTGTSGGGGTSFSFPQLQSFTSRTLLAAVTGMVDKQVAYLTEAGREGVFVFSSANNSSNVSNDPNQGVYVAPSSDTSGASGAWVRKSDGPVRAQWTGFVDGGAAAAGTVIENTFTTTASGDAGGTTDFRGALYQLTWLGTNSAQQTIILSCHNDLTHTSGTMTYAYGIQTHVSLGGGATSGVSTGAITNARVFEGHIANKSSNAQVISTGAVFFAADADLTRTGSTGTVDQIAGFSCGDMGHATKVTTSAISFDAGDMTAGAPTTANFRARMGSGTNKWAFLGTGSAPSALAGALRLGDNTVPTSTLEVKGLCKLSNDGSVVTSGSYHEIRTQNSGNTLTVSNSHSSTPNGLTIFFGGASPNNTTQKFLTCTDSTTNRLLIWSNGNVVNSNNSYGAISDAKLKTGIRDATPQLADIRALKVRKFKLKADGENAREHIGLIAQETEEISPGLVWEAPDTESYFEQEYARGGVAEPDVPLIGKGEWKERETGTFTKGVNYSVLYMKALKALQELADELDALKAEVAVIKAATS